MTNSHQEYCNGHCKRTKEYNFGISVKETCGDGRKNFIVLNESRVPTGIFKKNIFQSALTSLLLSFPYYECLSVPVN